MVFSSAIFLFAFLPLVLILYKFIPKRWQNLFLLIVSSAFYYYGEQNMLLLMYLVITVNYITARYVFTGTEDDDFLPKTASQKLAMLGCVIFCLGLLWYYKYFNFTLALGADLWSVLGLGATPANLTKHWDIVLPLGISFYTFHVLSYTLDVYFGRMKVEKNWLNFASYVLMFPQLVAGPIVRYRDICRQFTLTKTAEEYGYRTVTGAGFVNGCRRFCYGLAKKVLIANTVSAYVDTVFAVPVSNLSMGDCWLGAIAYTLQIYFDFSGYSDMAIGLAMLFGFHYKENFNYPYIAKSVSEFWRRWHISLSTWLRDYVYIHMGGNRSGKLATYRNVIIVFLCSGLWHGANMTFVCWGLIYGVFIVLEQMGLKKILDKCSLLAHTYLVILATTAWVLFRADTLSYGVEFIKKMYFLQGVSFKLSQELGYNIIFAMVLGCILSYDWRNAYKNVVISLCKD